jgi:diketogulonate reductase-like aldo/keto reductase
MAAGAGVASGPVRAEGSDHQPLLKRTIPRSGEQLPAVGLGTYQTFDVGPGANERAGVKEVLLRFVELGGRVVDSSPMYGKAETVVGDLAAELGVQKSLFLATKVWTDGRDAGIRQMQTSFQRLRTDRIDLMQVHNLVDLQTHVATLREWKKAGKIRYLGVTHYHAGAYDELERLVKTKEFDFVQFNYSIGEREAEQRLLKACADSGTAVLVNRPFAQADLFTKVRKKPLPVWAEEFDCETWAQFFLKYILADPAVTCVIPATRNPSHLLDNMRAGIGRLPDAGMRRRMVEYMEQL